MKWSPVLVLIAALSTAVPLPVAGQIGRGATRPKVERPDGPVWNVIRKNCTQCHGIDDYAFYALDRAGWQSLIETKHKSPLAEGTPVLSDDDPRTYVPPEITEFLSDAEALLVLNRSCVSCHGIDRVMKSRFSLDEWRVIAVQMKARGANISDVDLERLVEWLGRVKGTNANQ